mmetsp:Transcript_19046/g.46011  ORF Transcript_19046/g.46011 Transcript_19046/m.46011 type:complete len:161 (-) Transcript_19046:520-1002(-)
MSTSTSTSASVCRSTATTRPEEKRQRKSPPLRSPLKEQQPNQQQQQVIFTKLDKWTLHEPTQNLHGNAGDLEYPIITERFQKVWKPDSSAAIGYRAAEDGEALAEGDILTISNSFHGPGTNCKLLTPKFPQGPPEYPEKNTIDLSKNRFFFRPSVEPGSG